MTYNSDKNYFQDWWWVSIQKRKEKRWIFHRKNDISLIEGNWRNFVIMTECSDKLNCKGTKNIIFDYFDISIIFCGTDDSLKLIYA